MGPTRLPCGADYDDLVAQVLDHTAPVGAAHQETCPHCRAALAQLHDLWAPVRHLAAEDVHAPTDLLRTGMARVRELTDHTWFAFLPTERGHTRIAARVVAAVARLAAEEVPHVALALGTGRTSPYSAPAHIAGPETEAATDVGVTGSHVVVDIQVAVEMGAHIPDIADRVRAHIGHAIATRLDLTTAEVNVTIADVRPVAGSRTR